MKCQDIVLTVGKKCSVCNKKMANGYRAIGIFNKKNKPKAYCCNDVCVKAWLPEDFAI